MWSARRPRVEALHRGRGRQARRRSRSTTNWSSSIARSGASRPTRRDCAAKALLIRGRIDGARRGSSRNIRRCRATSASTRDFYDSLLKRYEEAQLADSREGKPQTQFSPPPWIPRWWPVEPLAPDRARPRHLLELIAALALAITAGRRRRNAWTHRFHSADDVRAHTRVPILVRIPRMPNDSPRQRTITRRRSVLFRAGGWFSRRTLAVKRFPGLCERKTRGSSLFPGTPRSIMNAMLKMPGGRAPRQDSSQEFLITGNSAPARRIRR